MRTAHAAGRLSIGFGDHWVPGANDATRALVEQWAEKEKVDVQIDYITSQGEKLLLTLSKEDQAKSGHDIIAMTIWQPALRAPNRGTERPETSAGRPARTSDHLSLGRVPLSLDAVA